MDDTVSPGSKLCSMIVSFCSVVHRLRRTSPVSNSTCRYSLDISLYPSLCLSLSAYADCPVEMGGSSGAVKISEAPDCHFYQFEGEKDEEFFVWAFVRFGLPVKREEVEKSDRRAKRRALREEAKKAGIYKDILQELRKETSVRPAKGAARKKATSPAAWRRNNHGVANGTWQSNNYGAPVRPWLFNNYDAPTGGRRYGHF